MPSSSLIDPIWADLEEHRDLTADRKPDREPFDREPFDREPLFAATRFFKYDLNLLTAVARTPEGFAAQWERCDEIQRSYDHPLCFAVQLPMLNALEDLIVQDLERAGTESGEATLLNVVGLRSLKALIAENVRASRAWVRAFDQWHELLNDIDPDDPYHVDDPETRLKADAAGRLQEYLDLHAAFDPIGDADEAARVALETTTLTSAEEVEAYCAHVRRCVGYPEHADNIFVVSQAIDKLVEMRKAQLKAAAAAA